MKHFETALNLIFAAMAILGAFLLTLAVVLMLTGCGQGAYTVRHEGQSRHDVVISLNLFGECSQLPPPRQEKCIEAVVNLLDSLKELPNGN